MDTPAGKTASYGAVPGFEVTRCPFCVLEGEFRAMLDLTGGNSGIFYCTGCRHLIRRDDSGFQCLCANCRKLNGAA